MQTKNIGFDRTVHRAWLDAVASKQAAGLSKPEMREFGIRLLTPAHPSREARKKTLTVLLHLWVDVPTEVVNLRNSALQLMGQISAPDRIVLHWGMALATYPFFRDIADTAGRLLALQEFVTLGQIQKRIAEKWGHRSTVERTSRHVVRSMVEWGALKDTKHRGTYASGARLPVEASLALWLVQAVLTRNGVNDLPLPLLVNYPGLFPFDLRISTNELRRAPQFILHRQALDEEIVALR